LLHFAVVVVGFGVVIGGAVVHPVLTSQIAYGELPFCFASQMEDESFTLLLPMHVLSLIPFPQVHAVVPHMQLPQGAHFASPLQSTGMPCAWMYGTHFPTLLHFPVCFKNTVENIVTQESPHFFPEHGVFFVVVVVVVVVIFVVIIFVVVVFGMIMQAPLLPSMYPSLQDMHLVCPGLEQAPDSITGRPLGHTQYPDILVVMGLVTRIVV
jgi:hypothetical protein